MAVFYQTYRPKNFSEIIGQEAMVTALQNASKNTMLGHAYLFTGGRGLGKTTLARILAKATNCQKLKAGDPCGKCEVCEAIAKGSFLDVVEIDAASHTGVDNIRELIENIHFQPSYGQTKVFIIDEVHMLSKAAFNALLKTLEEPPSHALFILATTDIHKVPETIISRTQRFDFKSISATDIKKVLQKIAKKEQLDLPKGSLDIIVENSEGGLRDALSQLGTISTLPAGANLDEVHEILGTTSTAVVVELLQLIAAGKTAELPPFLEQQSQNNFDARAFTRKVLQVLQEALESSLQGKESELVGNAYSVQQLMYSIRLFLRAYKEIDFATSPELPVLLAALEAAEQFTAADKPAQAVSAKKKELGKAPVAQQEPVVAKEKQSASVVATDIKPARTKVEKEATPLDEGKVKTWWPDLIDNIKAINSPLATLLKNSPIHSIEGDTVTVAVKYLFHKENVENTKHRALIISTASELAGSPVKFKAVITKVKTKSMDQEVVLSDAIKIFGGELVD